MCLNTLDSGLFRLRSICLLLGVIALVCPFATAAEHVTLKNGFEVDCVRRELVGDKVRLYLAVVGPASAADSNYLEVAADSVVRVETVVQTVIEAPRAVASVNINSPATITAAPTNEEMHEMLAQAGAQHNIDEDLLASVVRAESAGQVHAVSRTGARGLMQLMPGTASAMGVNDAFN